jgi:hypothetical protein
MTVRFGRSSTAAGAPSSGALAPRCTPAVVVPVGAPPPSDDLARDALTRWINGGGFLGGGGSVLGQICTGRPLFIGGFNLLIAMADFGKILA